MKTHPTPHVPAGPVRTRGGGGIRRSITPRSRTGTPVIAPPPLARSDVTVTHTCPSRCGVYLPPALVPVSTQAPASGASRCGMSRPRPRASPPGPPSAGRLKADTFHWAAAHAQTQSRTALRLRLNHLCPAAPQTHRRSPAHFLISPAPSHPPFPPTCAFEL